MEKPISGGNRTAAFTLDGSECEVVFGSRYKVFSVKSDSEVTVALESGKSAGDDGVMVCPAGESIMYPHMQRLDRFYITGSGNVSVFASNEAVNPFKKLAKGGDKRSPISENLIHEYDWQSLSADGLNWVDRCSNRDIVFDEPCLLMDNSEKCLYSETKGVGYLDEAEPSEWTVYVIFKGEEKHLSVFGRAGAYAVISAACNSTNNLSELWVELEDTDFYFGFPGRNTFFRSSVHSTLGFYVLTATRHSDGYTDYYINGVKLVENGYWVRNDNKRAEKWCVFGRNADGLRGSDGWSSSFKEKYLSIYDACHTEEQVKENTDILIGKYLN